PSITPTTPSPQWGATNPCGGAFGFLSVAVSVWQRSTIVPFRRTLPRSPQPPDGHVARIVVPRRVTLRCTGTGGQLPGMATVVGAPGGSTTGRGVPLSANSGGLGAGTMKRPTEHGGGLATRADAPGTNRKATRRASLALGPHHHRRWVRRHCIGA